jgi:hypothetical protein
MEFFPHLRGFPPRGGQFTLHGGDAEVPQNRHERDSAHGNANQLIALGFGKFIHCGAPPENAMPA